MSEFPEKENAHPILNGELAWSIVPLFTVIGAVDVRLGTGEKGCATHPFKARALGTQHGQSQTQNA